MEARSHSLSRWSGEGGAVECGEKDENILFFQPQKVISLAELAKQRTSLTVTVCGNVGNNKGHNLSESEEITIHYCLSKFHFLTAVEGFHPAPLVCKILIWLSLHLWICIRTLFPHL